MGSEHSPRFIISLRLEAVLRTMNAVRDGYKQTNETQLNILSLIRQSGQNIADLEEMENAVMTKITVKAVVVEEGGLIAE